MSLYAIIMAGGGGTRLWPLSRQGRPKQSLKIMGHQTLFQATVARLEGLIPPDRILVATVQDQAERLREQAPAIPAGNFLLEPQPKGTASVIGLAAVEIEARNPEAIMVCLPADHFIGDSDRFREALEEASSIASQGYLVSLGIRPTSAETGYGYLEAGSNLDGFGVFPASTVSSFKEKPDADLAREYVSSGRYFWNAGIFVWRAAIILQEIQHWMPELHAVLAAIAVGRGDPQFDLNVAWGALTSQTIDYGVMEHSERSAMVAVEGLGWWDVGSWDRLLSVLPGDEFGNVILAPRVELMNAAGNLVYQTSDEAARLVALIGVDNLIVVDTGDAILVTSREQAQKVRDLVQRLSETGEDRYL